jgi:hypothetical protein
MDSHGLPIVFLYSTPLKVKLQKYAYATKLNTDSSPMQVDKLMPIKVIL